MKNLTYIQLLINFNKLIQGVNFILARTLFYAQKNGYGEVSYFAKIIYTHVHVYNIQNHHLSCHLYRTSSYSALIFGNAYKAQL